MLYTEAVESTTLELLRSLQNKEYLKGFLLAGGTALALYNGHRRSADIDLFSNFSFDTIRVFNNINLDYRYNLFFSAPDTLRGAIQNIKTDIIAHKYPFVREPVFKSGISIMSEEDIIAMKLNAISMSGQRIKDFIDIYFLLEKYDISAMLRFYTSKYNQKNDLLIIKSLIYFEDVDEAEWPVLIKEPNLKWSKVKKKIEKNVMAYARGKG